MPDTSNDQTLAERDLSKLHVSITAPAFNEVACLEEFVTRVATVLDGRVARYEILIVENGSSDGSADLLKQLSAENPHVKYVALSRNFGHQGGLLAGMTYCTGDVVITMDADLQHPPESIPDMLQKWAEGFDIVGTRKIDSGSVGLSRRLVNLIFYRGLGAAVGLPLEDNQSDFRLLSREPLDALLAMPERDKFLRGLTYWIGFNQSSVPIEIQTRRTGDSKFSLASLAMFAVHGVISFTAIPLRLVTVAGSLLALGSILYSAFLVLDWLIGSNNAPSGFTTLATGMFLLGGLQLLGLGIIGEYLGQTLNQSRKRPDFIVRESNLVRRSPPGKTDSSDG